MFYRLFYRLLNNFNMIEKKSLKATISADVITYTSLDRSEKKDHHKKFNVLSFNRHRT